MRDENYYRDKTAKQLAKTDPSSLAKSMVMAKQAVAMLKAYFIPPEARRSRRLAGGEKIVSIKNHKRPLKQRLIRRNKHRDRMRNAA